MKSLTSFINEQFVNESFQSSILAKAFSNSDSVGKKIVTDHANWDANSGAAISDITDDMLTYQTFDSKTASNYEKDSDNNTETLWLANNKIVAKTSKSRNKVSIIDTSLGRHKSFTDLLNTMLKIGDVIGYTYLPNSIPTRGQKVIDMGRSAYSTDVAVKSLDQRLSDYKKGNRAKAFFQNVSSKISVNPSTTNPTMYCDILIDNIVVMQLFRNSDYGTVTVNMPSAFGADSKLVNACGLTRDDLIQSFNKIEESINSDKLVTLFIDKASELTKIKEVADILEISKFAIMKLSKKSESDFSDKSKLVINLPAIAKLIETNMTKVSTISLSDYEAALSHIETSSVANRYVNGTAIVTLYSINYNNDKLPMFETSSLNGKKNAKDSYSVALSHGLTSLGIPSSIARQMQSDRPKGFLDNVDEIRNHLIYLYKKHVK